MTVIKRGSLHTLNRTDTMVDTAKLLTEHGVRPSVQRLAVYQYLKEHPEHPTVDTLYLALAPSIPTLSKTTVYNTLKLLQEKRLVKSVAIENDELRYDAETSEHWHFKCTGCGKIYDVYSDEAAHIRDATLGALPKNFKPQKTEMNIWGLCSDCCAS
ncbi:Fur family transcriptional regulator [Treponema sp. HNW]|uniref:Fur family transcriptional regulator n=1 Tax=Treponema sp. HNW TaxID=3116654 RepID=UPI003D119CFE